MTTDQGDRAGVRESVTLEQALALTIELFKQCQAERDELRANYEDIKTQLACVLVNNGKLQTELKEARAVNEKLYAMRGEITRNDARTFGDLMLANASLSAKLAVAVSALEEISSGILPDGDHVDTSTALHATLALEQLDAIKGEGEA